MKKMTFAVSALLFLAGAAFAAQPAAKTTAAPARPAQPRMVQTDTTTVYDVSTKDKTGTTSYGVVEQTQTTPKGGTRVVSQVEYADYTPSKMALANEKKAEMSLGVGASYSFNKDTQDARFSNIGLAGTAQVLWDVSDHFALGADYMLLTPHSRNNHRGGDYKYEKLRLNGVALAGKYTINAWDSLSVYVPMGVGMANVRMKGYGTRGGEYTAQSSDKWGLDLFAGLGLQYNLTEDLFMGLEYRYTAAFVKSDDLNRYYGKDSYLRFHSAFLRVGTRF